MNQADFAYYDINFLDTPIANEIQINGEIKNKSGYNYSMLVFRVKLFSHNTALGSGIFKVAGLPSYGSKNFEATIKCRQSIDAKLISSYEIISEGGY